VIGQLFPGGVEFLVPFVIVATVVFAIVAVVTAHRDHDPAGTRPYAVYLSLVLFLAVFTALFSATALMSNLIRIPLKENALSGFHGLRAVGGNVQSSLDKGHVAGAVQAGLILVAALLVLWFHVRRLRELVQEPRFDTSPGRRTYQVYLHAVSFVSMATLLFAGAAALYGLFRAIAPGTTEPFAPTSFERGEGIAQAVATGFLALGAYALFSYHWHRTRTLRGVGPVRRTAKHSSPPPEAVSEDAPPPVIPPT
jgi:hypothetical protein